MVAKSLPTKADIEAAGLRILVNVPMERTIDNISFWHFWNIAAKGWDIPPYIYGRTDQNRHLGAWWLLDHDYTHIVMLDCDHIHPPDVVERLAARVMEDDKRLVVGGLNFRRTVPHDPCIFVADADGEMRVPLKWGQGVFPVVAIGHGCIIISREVFEQLLPPWWAYAYGHMDVRKFPSEDMYFSRICQEAGIELYVDTTLTSPHNSPYWATEERFREFLADNPDKVKVLPGVNGQKKKKVRKPKPKKVKA